MTRGFTAPLAQAIGTVAISLSLLLPSSSESATLNFSLTGNAQDISCLFDASRPCHVGTLLDAEISFLLNTDETVEGQLLTWTVPDGFGEQTGYFYDGRVVIYQYWHRGGFSNLTAAVAGFDDFESGSVNGRGAGWLYSDCLYCYETDIRFDALAGGQVELVLEQGHATPGRPTSPTPLFDEGQTLTEQLPTLYRGMCCSYGLYRVGNTWLSLSLFATVTQIPEPGTLALLGLGLAGLAAGRRRVGWRPRQDLNLRPLA
jgi:hypothetical protein